MFKKLVRDKIPELYPGENKYYTAEKEEYYRELVRKLQEEVDEFKKDKNIEELADIVEVIHALSEHHGASISELEKVRKEKAEKRGRFEKGIILNGNSQISALKINSNAIVTNSKGEFLLIRLKVGHFKGALCIPGGGVHPGELSHEAAKREVMEETGVEVNNKFTPFGFCELMNSQINQHKIVMLLHANSEGVPRNTREGEAGWYVYEKAKPELLRFADEAIRIWKNKEVHFKLTEKDVDIRDENLNN